MKVIGMTKEGFNAEYICTISHTEIEKFLNLYYDKQSKLKIGEELDLGIGHDFHSDIQSALRATENFIKENKKVVEHILGGISLVSRISAEKPSKKKESSE